MIKASYYAILPGSVRYSKLLKPVEKVLYAELTALMGTGAYCITDAQYL